MDNNLTVEPGSKWDHYNGTHYTVLFLTNESTAVPETHPVTVIYEGPNGKKWSRLLSDWHRSMRPHQEVQKIFSACATEGAKSIKISKRDFDQLKFQIYDPGLDGSMDNSEITITNGMAYQLRRVLDEEYK